jgi:hypothetical protein
MFCVYYDRYVGSYQILYGYVDENIIQILM